MRILGPGLDVSPLENRTYQRTPEGEEVVRIVPQIRSRDDLEAYRELKREEAAEILVLTEEASWERPYYPVIVTLAQPITITELNDMLSHYDPSISTSLGRGKASKNARLIKAALVKNEDKLIVNTVRFHSTTGKGQLSYETMSDAEQLVALEQQLAAKEEELNGITEYQLVSGIVSLLGGIHRDDVMTLNDDPRVFLADIGPIDLYQGDVAYAHWDDLSDEVARYFNRHR
jgi:hypothetical protein